MVKHSAIYSDIYLSITASASYKTGSTQGLRKILTWLEFEPQPTEQITVGRPYFATSDNEIMKRYKHICMEIINFSIIISISSATRPTLYFFIIKIH